jgi:hypothetical protein
MPPLFTYTGFGLQIASEIESPELMPSEKNQPDIYIRKGSISKNLFPGDDVSRPFILFEEKEFLLNLPGIAKYRSIAGKEIFIGTVRLFLLSITMAALLTQRQKILLHASAIIQNEKLILFIGDSGAGKSSIAAELSKRGYTLFTDDVCVLESATEQNDQILAFASYPMMKLWEDTIQALDNSQFDRSYKIRPALPKFGQFFHEQFVTKAYPIQKIFVLNPVDDGPMGFGLRKLHGMEAFEKLSQNTYRRQFIQKSPLQAIHLKSMGFLISNTDIAEITRSKKIGEISSFTDFVETLIGKNDTF